MADKIRAFSDIRKPGYEYAPETIERWEEYPEETGVQAIKPPAQFREYFTPDYIKRDLFERDVFRQLGINPFEIVPESVLEHVNRELPNLFDEAFGGSILWQDRGRLTKEQRRAWDEAVTNYRAGAVRFAQAQKASLIDQYNFMMNQFDNAARQYLAEIGRERERQKAEEASERRIQEAAAKQAAKPPKPPTTSDLNAALKGLKTLQEQEDISADEVSIINQQLRKAGHPGVTLQEVERDPRWWSEPIRWIQSKIPGGETGKVVEQKLLRGAKKGKVKYTRTATNPKTGEQVGWNPETKRWEPIR